MKRVDVAAGVLRDDRGHYFICRRTGRLEGLWEFPGGKREPGESFQRCLERELREELGLDVRAGVIVWEAEEQTADRLIRLAFVSAEAADWGALHLNVHDKSAFAAPDELPGYPFCPMDALFVQRLGNADSGKA